MGKGKVENQRNTEDLKKKINQNIVDKVEIKEQWREIIGTKGFYQISNLGKVKSFINSRQRKKTIGQILKPFFNTKGYPCVSLFKKHYRIHRLVAEHFIDKIEGKNQVNHIDGDKKNNRIENLEWVTNQENVKHYFELKKQGR